MAMKGDLNSLCEKRVAQIFDSRGRDAIAASICLGQAAG
jgi:hypothetical protein